jgi:hypothetical protein
MHTLRLCLTLPLVLLLLLLLTSCRWLLRRQLWANKSDQHAAMIW